MIRDSLISIAFVAFAITAFTSALPASPTAQPDPPVQLAMNMKTDLMANAQPHSLKLEKCAVEDCSDTPQTN